MVAAAILGFEKQKRQIDVEIAELRAMDSETAPASFKSLQDRQSARSAR
jgi:hypothetical protein